MSRGPGRVERQITDLFRVAGEARTFTVAELCADVFGGHQPTRVQRISVLRAAHRVLARARDISRRQNEARREARAAAVAKFGREPRGYGDAWLRFIDFYENHPAMRRADLLDSSGLENWRVTELAERIVVFHHRSFPVRVWAVQITPAGLAWSDDVAIEDITESRVSVRYQGVRAPLDRQKLGWHFAFWRGVYFVSERSGIGAARLDGFWRDRYGHLFPDRMPLEQARLLLGLPPDYTRELIITAFRQAAKRCHPDLGGTAEQFRELVKARDLLLASLGTSAPAPKEPTFAPPGTVWIRRSTRCRQSRLGGSGLRRLG